MGNARVAPKKKAFDQRKKKLIQQFKFIFIHHGFNMLPNSFEIHSCIKRNITSLHKINNHIFFGGMDNMLREIDNVCQQKPQMFYDLELLTEKSCETTLANAFDHEHFPIVIDCTFCNQCNHNAAISAVR